VGSPDREAPDEARAPVVYVTLVREHLAQVHDLLRRAFWDGVDGTASTPMLSPLSPAAHSRAVSDALQHAPEQATIIATYKRLVVGCALLSAPDEPYITYLAVRAGWERAQIATCVHAFFHNAIRGGR
jgi:hypothetical protein